MWCWCYSLESALNLDGWIFWNFYESVINVKSKKWKTLKCFSGYIVGIFSLSLSGISFFLFVSKEKKISFRKDLQFFLVVFLQFMCQFSSDLNVVEQAFVFLAGMRADSCPQTLWLNFLCTRGGNVVRSVQIVQHLFLL